MPLIETHHALSAADRLAEAAFVAELAERNAGPPPADRRAAYDAMVAGTPIAEGITCEPVDSAGARGVWVRPANAPRDRAILFLHGGGYHLGTAHAYRGLASQIARRAGRAAFVADYPLAPEAVFPAAYEAARAVWAWLGTQGVTQVALVGDSAGGGLALAIPGAPPPGAPRVTSVVVFSPWTDLALTSASMNAADTVDPVFTRDVIAGLARGALAGADAKDPRVSPLHGVPRGMPPVAIQVGTHELLRDEARDYAARAAAHGVDVTLDLYDGLHHVFQHQGARLEAARAALDDAAAFVVRHLAA